MWREPEVLRVPVVGGELTVGRWGAGRRTVVASHGITANHRSFGEVAWQLDRAGADVSLYAVDHRGRAGSASVPGPYGLDVHADDLVALLDHLGVPAAVLLGHSMGAYVAANAAERAGDRVAALVLVDGGLPIPVSLPDDADIESVVRSVLGPALDRLDLTFASHEEYLDLFRAHPAFTAGLNDVVEAYVTYDLVEGDGGLRSSVVKEAVLEDGKGPLRDTGAQLALARVAHPTTLLWAPRGLLDQTPGMLSAEVVSSIADGLEHVTTVHVDDVNHYTILMGEHGARAVTDAVIAAVSERRT